MITLAHVKFDFRLRLLTDAHIGDGGSRKMSKFGAAPPDHDPDVATVACDHAGMPILPATAVKGALRKAIAASPDAPEVRTWFGEIKEGEGGAIGCFSFYAARLEELTIAMGDLPFGDEKRKTWVGSHVAIDRKRGAAEAQKLFSVEYVPAGAVFLVAGTWFGPLAQAQAELLRLLAPFAREEGLAIGSGTRNGRGAARLDGAVRLIETRFNAKTGNVDTAKARDLVIKAPKAMRAGAEAALAARATLALSCPGPFASVDPHRPDRRGDNQRNRIKALRRDDRTPVLMPESVAGALRARAAWLSDKPDERFRKPASWKTPDGLTPVERLFGVAGWRGLLRIGHIKSTATPQPCNLTHIALDRFSGAVLDGTLFEHEAFSGVGFEVGLELERRFVDTVAYPEKADEDLFRELLKDLAGDMLPLGHATNRGYGWFEVKVKDREGSAA